MRETVGKHYGELDYHNFEHAMEVVRKSRELVAKCKIYDIKVDELIVILAALFHDAGYHDNHEEQGFASKEEYSADIAERELNNLNHDQELIMLVKECIIATHRNKLFETVEQKVLRAADLSGLAGPYEEFVANNKLLKQEQEHLQDRQIDNDEWKEVVKNLIEFYLSQDIQLTPEHNDEDGVSIFHQRAQENLNRFLAE